MQVIETACSPCDGASLDAWSIQWQSLYLPSDLPWRHLVQAQAKQLGDVAKDVHSLVLWRTRIVAVSAVLGGVATTGVAMATLYWRLLA